MPSYAKMTVLGHLGRGQETKLLEDGTGITSFSIAVSDGYYDKSGEWVSRPTTWVECSAFKLHEKIRDKLTKGVLVEVEGKVETQEWDDKKTGEKRTKQKLKVSSVIVFKKENANEQDLVGKEDFPAREQKVEKDDDLPF